MFFVKENLNGSKTDNAKVGKKVKPIDYKNENHWLSLPKNSSKDIDVFYLYPTSWRAKPGQPQIAEIDNMDMRREAHFNLKTQASAFETVGNIYAPYYRQFDVTFFSEHKDFEDIFEYEYEAPFVDSIASFEYYIKNYNKSKPYILVGHSQGSGMIFEILMKYMKSHPDVYKRMIAAYAIGAPVQGKVYEKFDYLKPAQKEDDIGVIISYNTQSDIVDGKNLFSSPNNVLINPISWKTTQEYASRFKSLGSRIAIDDMGTMKDVMHLADARIDSFLGVVISNVDRETFSSKTLRNIFPLGVLHENDINLFYYDLRHNAEVRTKKYLEE